MLTITCGLSHLQEITTSKDQDQIQINLNLMIPKETLTMFNMTKGVLEGPRLLPARRCCVQSMRAPC